MRKHIAVIYWFARTADDFADEGNISKEKRLENLQNFRLRLENTLRGVYSDTFDEALGMTINMFNLPPVLFHNLLDAFVFDAEGSSFDFFEELILYSKKSANPIGRLLLLLHNITSEEAAKASDEICTALQLTNFWQDASRDIPNNRFYFPKALCAEFGVSYEMLRSLKDSPETARLVKHLTETAQDLFFSGSRLLQFLPGRLKKHISVTIGGGIAILDKIEINNYFVLSKRPILTKFDFLKLFLFS